MMAKEKSLLVSVIAIAAIAGAFRRCGHAFGKEPQHFAQDYFTEDQANILIAEPKLSLRMAEVDPAKGHVIGLDADAGPVEPTVPETPTEPTEPETPAEPTEPETPAAPTEPEAPAEPAANKKPAAGAKPAKAKGK